MDAVITEPPSALSLTGISHARNFRRDNPEIEEEQIDEHPFLAREFCDVVDLWIYVASIS